MIGEGRAVLPVQIQCTAIVIRNDALEHALDGGAANFAEIAPNAMSYSDDCLSQASFMSDVDAEEYAKSLELRGLSRGAEQPDFVIVRAHNQSVHPPCDWLILFEYEQRLIATLRGNQSRTVIAAAIDEDYDPTSVSRFSAEEIAEQFEFVERKDNIDTYRHKETGQLVYHARQTETPDEIFSRAFKTVWQLSRQPGTPARTGKDASALEQSIAELQSLVAKNPDQAKPSLGLGMAWFAVGNVDAAKRQLDRAVQLDPEDTIALKELGGICLDQGDFDSAVQAATKAVAIKPDDPELLGNLAVSQLLAGDAAKANQTIQHALKSDPSDTINRNIQRVIDDVVSDRRDQPKSLLELMKPVPKKTKTTWIGKLFGSGN